MTAGPLVSERALLAGQLKAEPDTTFAWVLDNITVPRLAGLGLAIADLLHEDQEITLLDRVATVLATTSSISAESGTGSPAPPLPVSTELAALVERLAALGETGPATALPGHYPLSDRCYARAGPSTRS